MTTWGDLKKGDRVRAGGRVFEVTKAKHKGKKSTVTLEGNGGRFTSTVRSKDAVDRVSAAGKKGSLHDADGRMTRWAKPAEAKAELGPLLKPGDPAVAEPPPAEGKGVPWTKPADEAERAILDGLDAALMAQGDPEAGYYVPPVDLETVRAHLLIFHERQPFGSEVDALAAHDEEHRAAVAGTTILPINHWHTKKRPTP